MLFVHVTCLPRLLAVSPERVRVPLEQEVLPGLLLLHPPNLAQDLVQNEQLIKHLTSFVSPYPLALCLITQTLSLPI